MKLVHLLFGLINCEKIIKNTNVPACVNCLHYIPSIHDRDFTYGFNKCNKFGEKNIVTNEILYDFANYCRKDETKCGYEGKYFTEEPDINLKILKHAIISNAPNGIILLALILNIIIIIDPKK